MYRARLALFKFMPNKNGIPHDKTLWAYYFLKMYLLSLKMGSDSFNNCLMSFCFSFNIHSTNIIEHLLCAMLEKQPQDLIKTELHKKTIFLPLDNSNLVGELLYFPALWRQDKQLFSDVSADVLQKEVNYLHYDTHIWFPDPNFPSVHVSPNCLPMEHEWRSFTVPHPQHSLWSLSTWAMQTSIIVFARRPHIRLYCSCDLKCISS